MEDLYNLNFLEFNKIKLTVHMSRSISLKIGASLGGAAASISWIQLLIFALTSSTFFMEYFLWQTIRRWLMLVVSELKNCSISWHKVFVDITIAIFEPFTSRWTVFRPKILISWRNFNADKMSMATFLIASVANRLHPLSLASHVRMVKFFPRSSKVANICCFRLLSRTMVSKCTMEGHARILR